MFLGFSMKFSVAARSSDLCPVIGNRLTPYYMGPKTYRRTVGVHCTLVNLCLTLRDGTPMLNPSGNTGVMVCYVILSK